MDTQPLPSNSGTPEAGPIPKQPEDLRGLLPEQPARPEVAPAVGASPAPPAQSSGASTLPPKLTAADVAAAIAAVPGPSGPGVAMPAPTTAGDLDVIEPEWVDKAEDVVRAHQGDPYGEEEAIEDLQQDYLQKRYGHTVKDPDSNKPEGT